MSSTERRSARLSQLAFKLAQKVAEPIDRAANKQEPQAVETPCAKRRITQKNSRQKKARTCTGAANRSRVGCKSKQATSRRNGSIRRSSKKTTSRISTRRTRQSVRNPADDSLISDESDCDEASASSSQASQPTESNRHLLTSTTEATSTLAIPPQMNPRHHHYYITHSPLSQYQLSNQLRKETQKFEKACRQLTMLDQHIYDLHNSFSSSIECDRKTFKILYRMQLATYEGTRNAFIEYIERQMEKIKRLRFTVDTHSGASAAARDSESRN